MTSDHYDHVHVAPDMTDGPRRFRYTITVPNREVESLDPENRRWMRDYLSRFDGETKVRAVLNQFGFAVTTNHRAVATAATAYARGEVVQFRAMVEQMEGASCT